MPAMTAAFLRSYFSSSSNGNITNLYSDYDHNPQTPEAVVNESNRDQGEGEETEDQVSLFEVLLTAFKKVILTIVCTKEGEVMTAGEEGEGEGEGEGEERGSMEIGWPTEVRHVAHVTFDRFHGFLGLPTELEPDVPRRAPSASATVFGVSTESMQCSYDSRGNSIPTILLMLQKRLYAQGGLQVEGIFRITAENSEAEHVRDQLNSGIVPDDIDVHCLAGLIKAWFRELPDGVLDCLTPEQVMECETEEDYTHLVGLLPSAESALLDWAVNLMADVVQEERHNKMNEHNIATVFAPNMTQMADPLTALMHAVQVMNFLKTLIQRVVRERKETSLAQEEDASGSCSGSSDDNNDQDSPPPLMKVNTNDQDLSGDASSSDNRPPISHRKVNSEGPPDGSTGDQFFIKDPCHSHSSSGPEIAPVLIKPKLHANLRRKKKKTVQTQETLTLDLTKLPMKKVIGHSSSDSQTTSRADDKPEEVSSLSCVNSRVDRDEACR